MTDYNALPAHKAWAFTKDEDRKRRENAEHERRMESQRQNYRRLIDGGRS